MHNPEYQSQTQDLDPNVYVYKCSDMRKQSSYLFEKKVTRNVVDSLKHLPEKVPNEERSDKPHLAVKHMFECLYCAYSHRSQKQVLAAEIHGLSASIHVKPCFCGVNIVLLEERGERAVLE